MQTAQHQRCTVCRAISLSNSLTSTQAEVEQGLDLKRGRQKVPQPQLCASQCQAVCAAPQPPPDGRPSRLHTRLPPQELSIFLLKGTCQL